MALFPEVRCHDSDEDNGLGHDGNDIRRIAGDAIGAAPKSETMESVLCDVTRGVGNTSCPGAACTKPQPVDDVFVGFIGMQSFTVAPNS